jgi:hypothetical protein
LVRGIAEFDFVGVFVESHMIEHCLAQAIWNSY